jgi:hypothetical protein
MTGIDSSHVAGHREPTGSRGRRPEPAADDRWEDSSGLQARAESGAEWVPTIRILPRRSRNQAPAAGAWLLGCESWLAGGAGLSGSGPGEVSVHGDVPA